MRLTSALCALLVASVAVGVSLADDLTARAILSYQSFDGGLFSAAGFSQDYDATFQKQVTMPLRFRLSVRLQNFNSFNSSVSTRRITGFRQIQPSGEFRYELPKLQALFNFDVNRGTPTGNILAGTRSQDRLGGNLTWLPDRLPGITIEAQRNKVSDEMGGLSTAESLGSATLDYSLWKFRATATGRYSRFDDGQGDLARKTQDRQGTLTFENDFLGDRVTVYVGGGATLSKLDERAKNVGTTGVAVPVAILGAYHSIDDTPLDGRDHRIIPMPALIDRNLDVSTGVSLGPNGVSYHNFALDLGRYAGIDEIEIVVRDAESKLVPIGGSIRWSVYTSDDGVLWKEIPGGTDVRFDYMRSSYAIEFPLTQSRWFKAVNFGVNAVPTFVTEAQTFFHTELGPGRVKTDIRYYTGTATLSARPVSWVALNYYALYNSNTQRIGEDPALRTIDSDQLASIQLDPFHFLSVMLRYQRRPIQTTGQLSQNLGGWAGVVKVNPAPDLTLTLETQNQREDNQGKVVKTGYLVLHTYARIYDTLDLSMDVGKQTQDFATDQRQSTQRFITLVSNSELRAGLKLLATASVQRVAYKGLLPGGVEQLPSRDDRFTAELFWRPAQVFAIGARFGWGAGQTASGFSQRYRVEWSPFSGGAVAVGGSFDQDVDPATGRRSTRILFTPRWTLNRHALVDLNYSLISMSGAVGSRTRTVSFNLSLTR